ncbi:LuxR C-terminal-related transcriptional regulator [Amycolatopsis sp.]|uniref:helix-turn-helix transcriptional regulator n=1 Tax=Amycolatopsis sp. TaxID=37632 RepID=UPI002D805047|nr:LuxR C-terminal-related transcriptional regulator [Amycolatopsis sp.]HET6709499.1 LuxR C-terminal-related transcriptional regulator [Amycolatopsis sp.]
MDQGDFQNIIADARTLIQRAARLHEETRAGSQKVAEDLVSDADVREFVNQYLAGAAGQVTTVSYTAGGTAESAHDHWMSRLGHGLPDSEVEVRALVSAKFMGAGWSPHLRPVYGRRAEVRILNQTLPQFAVLDPSMVIIRVDRPAAHEYLAIRETHVVQSMAALFDALFEQGVDLTVAAQLVDSPDDLIDSDSRTVRVLALLGAGYTDEAAARQLGVSVRTYRRYVADAMGRLGVSSRFQAGVRAATLNLVPSQRDPV